MMSVDSPLVDCKVLMDALDPTAEHHVPCRKLLHQAQEGALTLSMTPQILAEFYSMVTNPRRVSTPRTPDESLDVVAKFVAMLALWFLVLERREIVKKLRRLRSLRSERFSHLSAPASAARRGSHRQGNHPHVAA